jgi:uncharacterized protein (DUF433 family)
VRRRVAQPIQRAVGIVVHLAHRENYTCAGGWDGVYLRQAVGGAMDWLERITVNPEQCGGRPCVRGMRIRVVDVLQLLAAGLTQEQILEEMPDLEPEDIQACLLYAVSRLEHPVLVAK